MNNFNKEASKQLNELIPDGIKLETYTAKKLKELINKKGSMKKQAMSDGYFDSYNMSRIPLNYQDNLYDAYKNLFPEYNLIEANKRYRDFYKFHPILSNCVDLHSTFPFTDFELMVDNEEVKEYYTYLAKDRYNLVEMNVQSARDETLLGEAVYLGNWDSVNLEWEEWLQYPPEFVEITMIPGTSQKIFTIKPDPEIQRILKENKESSKILAEVLEKVNSSYFKAAMKNEEYQLPQERTMYFANKVDGYSKRGYPLTKRALQDLMNEVDLRSLQHNFVQRHMFPIKIWKLGSPEIGWIPSQKHFQQFKRLLTQASADPDFNLIYHFGVQTEFIGTKDKIENLIPHFEFCAKRIMNAFFVNEALLNGDSPSYAGQVANTKLLMYRFTTIRESREREYRNKIFLPIARQQGLIVQEQGEKKTNVLVKSKTFRSQKYYLPEFMWRQQNTLNNYQLQQMLVGLYNDGAVPFGIITDILGLSDKILENYRKKEQQTYANKLTREIVDEMVKEDPNLSVKYVLGQNPIEIVKAKFKNTKELEETEKQNEELGMDSDLGGGDMGGRFDSFESDAPIDLDSETSEPGEESSAEETSEPPMSESGEAPSESPADNLK